jgi:4-hydroxybenzoate polyprenyltransferase/phosphoserine phosphatase
MAGNVPIRGTERLLQTGSSVPLVVDLDGTLVKTNLLQETANEFITRRPLRAYRLAGWLMKGKCVLKARLAESCTIDPATLPYDEPLLSWLRNQKEQGRRLILATASHRLLADAVEGHLDMFDEVLASDEETNLKSDRKRDQLVDRYGERGFDYVGNSAADLPVWYVADRAYVVNASKGLATRVGSLNDRTDVIGNNPASAFASLFRALRPHQWVKNVLVLVPLLAAHRYGDSASVIHSLLGLVVFCLLASGVYLLNDLVDVGDDRHHLRKRLRPFASGELSLLLGWVAWPLLIVAACVIAGFFLPPLFLGALAAYYVLTMAYSLRLKQFAVIDVFSLAGLYTLRIVAGAAAIAVQPSFWLLAFSIFFFLSLAFIKRFSELKAARSTGRGERIRGRGYVLEDLEMVASLGVAAGYIAILVLALYVNDSHTAQLYRTPRLIWLACPLLLFWITRAWLIAHRGDMHDDPIVFALRDRTSWVVGACFVALFALARVIA